MITLQRTATLGIVAVGAMSIAGTAKSASRNSPFPKSIEQIPLAECTVERTLGVDYATSVQREAASAQQELLVIDKMGKLVNSLPNRNIPISKQLNSDQAAQFEDLRVSMIIQNLDKLAESRMQRDEGVMMDASYAIRAIEQGASKLTSKDDPKGEGAAMVGLLRTVLEKDQTIPLADPDPNACSIDLALYRQEILAGGRFEKFMQTSQARMFFQLRKKYGTTGPLDPQKLPSPDREEAVWLMKAVGVPMQRAGLAMEDWHNLRWYAKVSELEYKSLRNDILNGGGSTSYEYDTTIRSVAASADAATKRAIVAWNVIEKSIPSEEQALEKQGAGTAKRAAGK